jgi:hypothetical protein
MIKVTLNKEKHGMCFVGSHVFNFDNPGPIEINVETLSAQDRNQFIYNYRQRVLKVENIEELLSGDELPAMSNKFMTPGEKPLTIKKKNNPRDIIEQETRTLNKLLRRKVGIIQETTKTMPVGQLRRLLEIEITQKNRKKLVSFINDILNKHANSVMNNMGEEDLEVSRPPDHRVLGINRQYLDNISEVVESDIEQIILNPPEE